MDFIWFAKYIPAVKRWVKIFKDVCSQLNDHTDKKLRELSEDTAGSNFISLYLRK